jgi:hypothetical protein
LLVEGELELLSRPPTELNYAYGDLGVTRGPLAGRGLGDGCILYLPSLCKVQLGREFSGLQIHLAAEWALLIR